MIFFYKMDARPANMNQNTDMSMYTNCGPPMPPPWMMTPDQVMYMMAQQNQFGPYPPQPPHPSNSFVKESITIEDAVLQPPNPNAPPLPNREKPRGCRTVFVGGVPSKCTQNMLQQIFEKSGEIQTIRLSQKNFAHIRFADSESVDRALFFSGYRIRIGDRSEREYCGKLHVDYAHARDDAVEFIMLNRQERRSTSPPPTAPYSDNDAQQILEKLKSSADVDMATDTLKHWLDKGNCSKRNSTVFYNMLAALSTHVRRLSTEKIASNEILQIAKDDHKLKMQRLMTQFSKMEETLTAARKQRNWDQFSKAQRKNVDLWMKQTQEHREEHENDMLRDREEMIMDLSDEEGEPNNKMIQGGPHKKMEGRPPYRKLEEGPLQQKPEGEPLQTKPEGEPLQKEPEGEPPLKKPEGEPPLKNPEGGPPQKKIKCCIDISDDLDPSGRELKLALDNANEDIESLKRLNETLRAEVISSQMHNIVSGNKNDSDSVAKLSETHSFIIGILCPFLQLYPKGVSVVTISHYMAEVKQSITVDEILDVLQKYSNLFSLSKMNDKWYFVGLINSN